MGFISYNAKMMLRLALKRTPLFHRSMVKLEKFRAMEPYEQRAHQLELLENTLAAAAWTKHYASNFASNRKYDSPVEQLKTIPYLTKEALRRSPRDFVVNAFPGIPAHTSGTTGTPLKLRRDLSCVAHEEAAFFSWRHSAGWTPEDMMIVLRGDMVVPASGVNPPFGIRDFVFNRHVLSSYHLSDRAMPWYVARIRDSGARFISAYPSSAFVLADYLRRKGERPLGMKAVFLASETIFDHQKELIQSYMGPVFGQYGNAERVCWMTTCTAGRYHEDVSYGFTEYVPLGDGMYEIVATGFINRSMPLLRYRTGDIAIEPFGRQDRCPCGRAGPGCKEIIGRLDDLLVTPDGRRIGRLDHVFKGVENVVAAQIVQRAPDQVEIKVVRDRGYGPADEDLIGSNFTARVGGEVAVTFKYVEDIPRTKNGKFRAVVSVGMAE